MQGQIESNFITHINMEFICFTVTVMQHNLKCWSSGIYHEQGCFRGPMPKGNHRG